MAQGERERTSRRRICLRLIERGIVVTRLLKKEGERSRRKGITAPPEEREEKGSLMGKGGGAPVSFGGGGQP